MLPLVNTPGLGSLPSFLGGASPQSGALASLNPLLVNPLALFGTTSIPTAIAATSTQSVSPTVTGAAVGNNPLTQTLGSLGQALGLMANSLFGANVINNPGTGQLSTSGGINTTFDPIQRDRLDQSLAKISQNPEGAALLQQAVANGYTIEVGNASFAASGFADLEGGATLCAACQAALDAGGQVNGVTLPGQKKIVVDPNATNFDKTLVHELVHAASENDGNSQAEEGIADVIGFRVASQVNGQALPGSEAEIFNSKIQSYPGLQPLNNIQSTLAGLGISAF